MVERRDDEWEVWWKARVAAMENVLGKSDDTVLHAVVPLGLAGGVGGAADVIFFRHHIPGRVCVTCDLIGRDEQVRSKLGNYELMICHRDDEEWGPRLISQLAGYTFQAKVNPGDTMGVGPAAPERSAIEALLFQEYARFKVRGRKCGLLLCIGITEDELDACLNDRREEVERALKEQEVFPYTDLYRRSVLSS